jgi:beta-lactamase regulating signal transducer with metallopeptidase domain
MMLAGASPDLMLTPVDSVRAVANVYTVSLLATIPLVVAAGAAIAVRRLPAGTRSLVWRSALVALLIVYVGRQLPVHALTWIVPAGLAGPLVVLGRLQVAVAAYVTPVHRALGPQDLGVGAGANAAVLVRAVLVLYWTGVIVMLLPVIAEWLAARSAATRARRAGGDWDDLVDEARATLGVARRVRALITREAIVPTTWGVFRPVILLPAIAEDWTMTQRRAVVLHEMAHVCAVDSLFGMISGIVCALYWFHPGAWWVARRLRADREFACDDRVLASGVRPSDYAELLAMAADRLCGRAMEPDVAMAMSRRVGLRARLAAVLDPQRDLRAPTRTWIALAATLTVCVAGPISAVELAPTRDVLTSLMLDSRWESRAYAVLGLAQRADSIAVARAAATRDPSPRVRAWAQYALEQQGEPSPAPVLVPLQR